MTLAEEAELKLRQQEQCVVLTPFSLYGFPFVVVLNFDGNKASVS